MSEIERYQAPQISELDLWATRLYESGMFKDVKDVAEAFVKVVAGAELGLSPSQSMRGVHVIQGKTIIGAGLLSSLLDRPPYDFTTKYLPNIENPTSCTITVYKNGIERGQSHFSLDDARRAGLLKSGGNWEKYPSDMLFARAVSQAARRYAAGALGGAVYVEAHGEMEITPTSSVVDRMPTVAGYVTPGDTLDDVPFEDSQDAAPAASYPAESQNAPGQTAAEPAGTASPGGLIIETLQDAQSLINALDGPQLGVMKSMLGIHQKTTRRLLAESLLEQRHEWDSQDVLAEMAGWA